MARRLRYHLAEATYHVMLRGNDGQKIFFDDNDRCRLCLLIQEGVERFGHRVHGFCFMTNHIHLAIQVRQVPLSRIMQNLSFRYTRYINRKNQRIGHLFQGRFKSVLVDSDRYLKELVRYIHLNPVRAGIVRQPENFRWSSHNTYLGTNELVWMTTSDLLKSFGNNSANTAISCFQSFAGVAASEELDFERGMQEGILGDDDFVQMVRKKEELVPLTLAPLSVSELVQIICELYKFDVAALKQPGKSRRASHLRALLAMLVRDADNNFTLEELAKIVGRDASSLSKHAARLTAKSLESEELQNELSEARNYLLQMPECQA